MANDNDVLVAELITEQESPDYQALVVNVPTMEQFLGRARLFFQEAHALELKADATLVDAQALVAPTTEAEDLAVQQFIKRTQAETKALEEKWKITVVAHRIHSMLTAARGRAAQKLKAANDLGQKWHNAYVTEENRRAAEEQEVLRLAAEAEAQRAVDAAAAAAESEALRLEEGSPILSKREESFVELMVDFPTAPVQSAKMAGYKNPSEMGPRLMTYAKILDAIHAKKTAARIRAQAAARLAAPVYVDVPTVRPNITTGRASGGVVDRTTHAAEIVDAQAFVKAVVERRHNIPLDCLMPDPTKIAEYARSMREQINRWPGVKYKKTTKGV